MCLVLIISSLFLKSKKCLSNFCREIKNENKQLIKQQSHWALASLHGSSLGITLTDPTDRLIQTLQIG